MPTAKKPKGPNGGAREGAGRPRNITQTSTVKRATKRAQDVFDEKGYCPITALLEQRDRLEAQLVAIRRDHPNKHSQHTALETAILKLNTELLSYFTPKAKQETSVEFTEKKPLAIKLNLPKPANKLKGFSK